MRIQAVEENLNKENTQGFFVTLRVNNICGIYDSQEYCPIFIPKKSLVKKNTNPSCEKFVLFVSGEPSYFMGGKIEVF